LDRRNKNEYTPNQELKIFMFEKMTEEWLDFIVACRTGKAHDYEKVGTDVLLTTDIKFVKASQRP
jgi:hypothetical protein